MGWSVLDQLALVARNLYTLHPDATEKPVRLIEVIFVTHDVQYTATGDRQTVATTHRVTASPAAWAKVAADIIEWVKDSGTAGKGGGA